jgi:hypothetical protein
MPALMITQVRNKHLSSAASRGSLLGGSIRTWKRMVRRASGAVQVLLMAPATPPARRWGTVPSCGWWCCSCDWVCRCCCCCVAYLRAAVAAAALPPSIVAAAILTLASVCIRSRASLVVAPRDTRALQPGP